MVIIIILNGLFVNIHSDIQNKKHNDHNTYIFL